MSFLIFGQNYAKKERFQVLYPKAFFFTVSFAGSFPCYFTSTISATLQSKMPQSTSMVCIDTYMFFRIRPSCPALKLYWVISRYWLMPFRCNVFQNGAYDIPIVISPLSLRENGNSSNRVGTFYHKRPDTSRRLFLTFLWL